MASVNWDLFERLPGAADVNFENLCRAVIRRTYGRYGEFLATANQPGVEFHLRLHTDCSLGKAGEWIGWQCKWYDLPSGRPLGANRRTEIENSLDTTGRHLPNLTRWILWTRRPLTAGDQTWFTGLTTTFLKEQWTAKEVEEHLSGEAEVLRATYFGELVLTPTELESQHQRAVAPIRRRWMPEVHQSTCAERELGRVLGDVQAWDELWQTARQLDSDVAAVEAEAANVPNLFVTLVAETISYARSVGTVLQVVRDCLEKGKFDSLLQQLATGPASPSAGVASLPRRLRAARSSTALLITNAIGTVRHARRLLGELSSALDLQLVAVSAGAGCGKTQLAAQLTASSASRPSGVLLHGGDLQAGKGMNQLASMVVIQGKPVLSFEALVAALDAAGQRSGRRIPIVIDGLNEAEDPRDWKRGLATLGETVRPYRNVLVVCTLRPAFVDEALPDGMRRLEISGFEHDTAEAVWRYFTHFKIDRADADLSADLLQHPLTLRLFCEVTNPDRSREVGVEAMPGSLTVLFERYLGQVTDRIADLASVRNRYYPQDVRVALAQIGAMLWDQRARRLSVSVLRQQLRDEGRPWDQSLVRALEQDGVLLRDSRDERISDQHVIVSYDLLAGHLVADAILDRHSRDGLAAFLRSAETVGALSRSEAGTHTLAEDILTGLVGLVPRRFPGEQVWQMVGEPLRSEALRQTAWLDGRSLDGSTVDALAELALQPITGWGDGLFGRLRETRGARSHPLDARFLDRVLRPMAVSTRDLHWTEWVRRNWGQHEGDLQRLEGYWRTRSHRTPVDHLRARWVMWLLTSTVRVLRDQATRALYWFGRFAPAALFDLAIDSLEVNDPYVPQRMLAASYGVVMAHQLPDLQFAEPLGQFLTSLSNRLFQPSATHPTDDWLVRMYVQGVFDFARRYYPDAIPPVSRATGPVPFAPGRVIQPIPHDDPRVGEVGSTLHMDFENYTLGHLVAERRNYDMEHPGHRAAVAHVCGVVWSLGWRDTSFAAIERSIAEDHYSRRGGKIERYGKKYGWIGFYAYGGLLAATSGLPDADRLDLDLDPSFPEPPPPAPVDLPAWVSRTPSEDSDWLRSATVVPEDFLLPKDLNGQTGPWVAVSAYLNAEDAVTGRDVFGRGLALLVEARHVTKLLATFGGQPHVGGRWIPNELSDYYTFAGEIPWASEFGRRDREYDDTPYRVEFTVGGKRKTKVEVEMLAHHFAWEDYHSPLNTAAPAVVPSRLFSTTHDLRAVPQSFDQCEPGGQPAALSFRGPEGFEGQVLYLRRDLVDRYAAGRRLVWLMWGERRLLRRSRAETPEILAIYQARENEWHVAREL